MTNKELALNIYTYELKNYYYNNFTCFSTSLLNKLIKKDLLNKKNRDRIIQATDEVLEEFKYELHDVIEIKLEEYFVYDNNKKK